MLCNNCIPRRKRKAFTDFETERKRERERVRESIHTLHQIKQRNDSKKNTQYFRNKRHTKQMNTAEAICDYYIVIINWKK